jgi:hypothetical protein
MATIVASGEVARLIPGYGFKLVETKTVNGEERKVWITVWTDAVVREGQKVIVKGDLSTKLETFTGRDNTPKTTVAINVNNAQVKPDEDLPF